MGCSTSVSSGNEVKRIGVSRNPQRGDSFINKIKTEFHGDFVMLRKLGRGASAQVYAVKHKRSASKDPEVFERAVKIIDLRRKKESKGPPIHGGGDVDLLRRAEVRKEIMILKQIGTSSNCVSLEASFVEGHFSYMVMEKASLTLLRFFERVPELTEQVLAVVFTQMLTALSHVHKCKVVHRDVKPDNFLCFGSDNTVKLCDFGLADCINDSKPALDGVFGTAPFMSPEMLSGHKYDEATDVWSFAVIAYVLLFGHFPYQPLEKTSKAMKAAILANLPAPRFKPKTVSGSSPVVTASAVNFVKHLLVRDPAKRPSADEALKHAWLPEAAARRGSDQVSLRTMVFSAKREGTFDVRQDAIENEWTDIDQELYNMQEKRHGAETIFRNDAFNSEKHSSIGSTRAGSENTSDGPGPRQTSGQASGRHSHSQAKSPPHAAGLKQLPEPSTAPPSEQGQPQEASPPRTPGSSFGPSELQQRAPSLILAGGGKL